MNEKTPLNETNQAQDPPPYSIVIGTQPPPPSYIQSTVRLHYKNKPYISDLDQHHFQIQYQQSLDQWKDISSLPLHERWACYAHSWSNAIRDGRFVFFACFVLGSVLIMGLVITIIALPSLISHN